VAAVHGGPEDSTRSKLVGRRYRAHKLTMMMQGWVEGHDDSHHVRQPVIWWRRRGSGGDEVAAANPSEDSSLGARRAKWSGTMRCGIVRWRCLL
jgi:hypothetical protein